MIQGSDKVQIQLRAWFQAEPRALSRVGRAKRNPPVNMGRWLFGCGFAALGRQKAQYFQGPHDI